jgi:serine/threonine-protein kinase RsbW
MQSQYKMDYKLKVSCSIENLKEIRSFVSKRLEELSVNEIEINMMILAVDEICANLIIHSNNSDTNQYLEVKIIDKDHGISFEIFDKGQSFDINNYQAPALDDLIQSKRKGGLGLMLVKRIMDKIEFKKEKEYTVCHLFKKVTFANHSA